MIVVTAPTSNIGSRVLRQLLDAGEDVRVIARHPSKLPEEVRRRVAVVEGTHRDEAVVAKAFAGANAVFWLVPSDPTASGPHATYVDFSRAGARAFREAGVRHVVGISALGRGTPMASRAGLITGSLAMDDLLAASGVAFRAVTCPSFMDNVARQVKPIREQGLFFGPDTPERTKPVCAVRDIAAVSAGLLLDRTWSGTGERPVLGPEDLSYTAMAEIMSDVLGKPVHYRQLPLEAYKSMFLGYGYTDAMAQAMVDMAQAKNDGLDNAEPRNAGSTTPTSFRQWCEEELKPRVSGSP